MVFSRTSDGEKPGPGAPANEPELRETIRELQDAARVKDEYLARLSHELRTPLNVIVGWAHMLRSSELDEGLRMRAVDAILRSADSLTQMVAEFVDRAGRSAAGAAYEIALRRLSDPEAAVGPDEESRRRPLRSQPGPRLVGVRALVVDDDRETRELVTAALRQCGATVSAAAGAAEALELFGDASPDVVIADLEMPQMDGYTFIEAVRSRPRARGGATPALALTAHASAAHRLRA
ncbi:MAG TPA: response regulator, partial [Vicinamibacteria bacterium]